MLAFLGNTIFRLFSYILTCSLRGSIPRYSLKLQFIYINRVIMLGAIMSQNILRLAQLQTLKKKEVDPKPWFFSPAVKKNIRLQSNFAHLQKMGFVAWLHVSKIFDWKTDFLWNFILVIAFIVISTYFKLWLYHLNNNRS